MRTEYNTTTIEWEYEVEILNEQGEQDYEIRYADVEIELTYERYSYASSSAWESSEDDYDTSFEWTCDEDLPDGENDRIEEYIEDNFWKLLEA